MAATAQQTAPWDLWERSFGLLRDGAIGTVRHDGGKTFRVRLLTWERVGDQCHFVLDIIDEAAGNA
jgi:hypothetical protein